MNKNKTKAPVPHRFASEDAALNSTLIEQNSETAAHLGSSRSCGEKKRRSTEAGCDPSNHHLQHGTPKVRMPTISRWMHSRQLFRLWNLPSFFSLVLFLRFRFHFLASLARDHSHCHRLVAC
jgi:hypothetical protein